MDAGRLEQQVASVERGIAFLKQEHLAMLTGLQLEITHLKRRCHGQSTGDQLLSNSLDMPLYMSLYLLTLSFFCLPSLLLLLLLTELSCELDSKFPDRNTSGKISPLLADERGIDTWETLIFFCHHH